MPHRSDEIYRDALRVAIEHAAEIDAGLNDLGELENRRREWLANDARAASFAAEMLVIDAGADHERALAKVPPHLLPAVARHAVSVVEQLFHIEDDAAHLLRTSVVALDLAHKTPAAPETVSEAWRLYGDALRCARRFDEARDALHRACAAAARTRNREYYVALVQYSTAILHLELDQNSRASANFDGIAAAFRKNRDNRRAVGVLELEAWTLMQGGNATAAAEKYRDALSCDTGEPTRALRLNLNLGRCYLEAGDCDAARATLACVRAMARQSGEKEIEAVATYNIAEVEASPEMFDDAARLFDEIGRVGLAIRAELSGAERELELGQDIAGRCRSISLRACGCVMDDVVRRRLLALESRARHDGVTTAELRQLRGDVPASAMPAEASVN